MKYIFKLTIFMVLGLLLVSCSKSNTNVQENGSIKLQGVLEKGKVTSGLCQVSKLYEKPYSTSDEKPYSESNHIKNGTYTAIAPLGAFKVICTIETYIDDITGQSVIAKTPFTLEAVSFAKSAKSKTLNVNVITDLVAKEVEKDKGLIKDEDSFYAVMEPAKITALSGIERALNQRLGDLDTLHLDKTPNNPLTKFSLAVQKQLDKNPQETTIDSALQAALYATGTDSIEKQDATKLNANAMATQSKQGTTNINTGTGTTNINTDTTEQVPIPAVTTLGGDDVSTSPSAVNTLNKVLFSMPASSIENLGTDGVYITSNKVGAKLLPVTISTDQTKYENADVRDLFKLDATATIFTTCVLPPTPTPTVSICLGTTEKQQTFTATAADSIKHFTVSDDVRIGGKQVAMESAFGIYDTTLTLPFEMPAAIVIKTTDKKIYITSDKTGASILPLTLSTDKTKYENADIKGLFKFDGIDTTFTICFLPTTATATSDACKAARAKQNFKAKGGIDKIKYFVIGNGVFIGNKQVGVPSSYDTIKEFGRTSPLPFKIPVTIAIKTNNKKIYITSDKTGASFLPLTLSADKTNYENADIVGLFRHDSVETQLTICILPAAAAATSAACKEAATRGATQTFAVDVSG